MVRIAGVYGPCRGARCPRCSGPRPPGGRPHRSVGWRSRERPVSTPLDYDPVPGAISHELQVVPVGTPFPTEDPTPSDVTTGLGPIARQLDGGTEYKWRVRSWATQTITGPWSEIHTFTTPAVIPIAMTGPADGVTVDLDDLALTWTPVAGQPAMSVQVSATPDFDAPMERAAYADGSVPRPGPAEAGTWYWRVLAGRDAIVARSPVRSLTIEDDTPPAGLVGFPAARGSTPYDSISLEWRAEDLLSDVATVAISGNARTGRNCDWIGSIRRGPLRSLSTARHRSARHLVRFRDGAGNWSTPLRQWTIYEPEAQPLPAPAVAGPRATVLANEPLVHGRPALLCPGRRCSMGGRSSAGTSSAASTGTAPGDREGGPADSQ